MSALLDDDAFSCDGRPFSTADLPVAKLEALGRPARRHAAPGGAEKAFSRLLLDFLKDFSSVRQRTACLTRSGRARAPIATPVELEEAKAAPGGTGPAEQAAPERAVRVPPFVAQMVDA